MAYDGNVGEEETTNEEVDRVKNVLVDRVHEDLSNIFGGCGC